MKKRILSVWAATLLTVGLGAVPVGSATGAEQSAELKFKNPKPVKMQVDGGRVQALETIKLPPVGLKKGKTVMQALQDRHSDRTFSERELPLGEIAGLLWAANGYNRPDRRTNATGLNRQSIVVYLCRKDGTYRFDARQQALIPAFEGDLRPALAGHQDFARTAPVILLITADVSDLVASKGKPGTLTHYDAGIVSGNVYLYCSAMGLSTVCRASMDREAVRKALKLPETTILHLNHPVGYPLGE